MPEPAEPAIGRFRILGTLGIGGFATVYRAEDPALGRQVALKVLHAHLAADPDFVRRFQAEARAAARLRHPRIVTIHDVGTAPDGRPYLVMELLEGRPLSAVVSSTGAMPIEWVIRILSQLASALDYLHAQGLVHRDIKPVNVMVGDTGDVTLMDFGIARFLTGAADMTPTGEVIGTPAYLAPEQIAGGAAGPAADVYALGVLGYELLTGRPPFVGSPAGVIYDQLHTLPMPVRQRVPTLPALVAETIDRALAKDPSERLPSASAFNRALTPEAAQSGLPRAQTASSDEKTALFSNARQPARIRARSMPAVLVGIAALLVLGGTVGVLGLRFHPHFLNQAVARTPSTSAPATAAPALSAGVTLAADDAGANASLAGAQQNLAAILIDFRDTQGLAINSPLFFHLASSQAAARTHLREDLRLSSAATDQFFANKHVVETATGPTGIQVLVYLPDVRDLRGSLAFAVAGCVLRSYGGLERVDAYPYWFLRGFQTYEESRFSTVPLTSAAAQKARAAQDARSGVAPMLGGIATDASAQALLKEHSGALLQVDARSEAALEYLAESEGAGTLSRLLKANAFGSIAQFNALLVQLTGMAPDELDANLNRWLQQ